MPSPTVPTSDQSESDVLDVRAEVWQRRPLLREIYRRYFAEMTAQFATSGVRRGGPGCFGLIVEIGGGAGNFKEFFLRNHGDAGRLIATDIVPTGHCDLAADAMALPFADGSVDNLVMMDVLHHIPYPLRFLTEAQRILRRGGRLVMTEPYISPASRIIFAVGHPEPVVMRAKIFGNGGGGGGGGEEDPCPLRGEGAFASNQATPRLLFYRDRKKVAARFPGLRVVKRLRRSLFVYPLSGGFSGPKLLPRFLEPFGWGMEKVLSPLAFLLACRLVVVIEKV